MILSMPVMTPVKDVTHKKVKKTGTRSFEGRI